jgi:hypothetical protein
MNFWQSLAEVVTQVKDFIVSPDFQALATAAIGFVTSIALINNKVAAMRVAKTDNLMLQQQVDVNKLEKKVVEQTQLIEILSKKIELQSGMFSAAFLNSRKLDAQTKQEIAKFAKALTEKKPEQDTLIEKVVEVAKSVIKEPIKEVVENTANTIFEKLTKL